ncbi:hypothetical protein BH23BAC2_BH23BAC2_03810 [soil metagenome]
MDKLIIILLLMVSGIIRGQGNFEKGMSRGMELWKTGQTEEASAIFERIAAAEKNTWLPNYYVALVNTTAAFNVKEYQQVNKYLARAQVALNKELDVHPENAELLVLQAMVHTAWIAYDPMSYGQTLSGKVSQLYAQAEKIEPTNPRVVLNKAQFQLGTARFFGSDTKPICAQLERSIDLFDNFSPETSFHPTWGKEQAMLTLSSCK